MSINKTKIMPNNGAQLNKMKSKLSNPKGVKTLTLLIDGDLMREFKKSCAVNETTMTDVITRAIQDYLK